MMVVADVVTNSFDLTSFLLCTPEIVVRLRSEQIQNRLWTAIKRAATWIWGSKTPQLGGLIGSAIGAGLVVVFFGNGLRFSMEQAAKPIAEHDYFEFHIPIAITSALLVLAMIVVFIVSIGFLLVRIFEILLEAYSVRKMLFVLGVSLFLMSRVYALVHALVG